MLSLFKRSNGIYYISFEEEGKRKWKSTGQRHKAAALKELLTFDKSRNLSKPRITLQGFVRDFLSNAEITFSAKTLDIYKRTLHNFSSLVGDKLLKSITAKDVDLYRTYRLKAVSPISVNIELRTLKAAFYTAVQWKLLADNPLQRVSLIRIPDQQPTYLSKEDLQNLLCIVSEGWLKEIIIIAVSTGLRRGELLNLTWKDVDFERRLLYIQSKENFRTKGGRRRTVPMSEAVFQLLWKNAQSTTSEYVFNINGRRILGDWVSHRFKFYVRKAGLNKKLHFHSLRHTFATWLVQEGVSIYEVQKLLGHSSISVTQIYSHLAASELHSAVNKISLPLN